MKNKKNFLILSIVLLFSVLAVFASGNKENIDIVEDKLVAQYNKITAEDAKNIFDTQKDITIIDVRTEEEFASGHIENAINIPLNILKKEILNKYPDKSEKLYLYCRSGNRSSQGARVLVEEGYYNIYDFGGIIDWPYEIVKWII